MLTSYWRNMNSPSDVLFQRINGNKGLGRFGFVFRKPCRNQSVLANVHRPNPGFPVLIQNDRFRPGKQGAGFECHLLEKPFPPQVPIPKGFLPTPDDQPAGKSGRQGFDNPQSCRAGTGIPLDRPAEHRRFRFGCPALAAVPRLGPMFGHAVGRYRHP